MHLRLNADEAAAVMRALAARPPGPYTIAWARETIESLGLPVPSELKLALLATQLNGIADFHKHSKEARDPRDRVDEVNCAMGVLTDWIEDRRKNCETAGVRHPKVIDDERRLRDKFTAFKDAFASHPLSLPMDAWMAPPLAKWNDFARFIFDAFNWTMAEIFPDEWRGFGTSDRSPAVRFAVKALEVIGAPPQARSSVSTAEAVFADYLRKKYRKKTKPIMKEDARRKKRARKFPG